VLRAKWQRVFAREWGVVHVVLVVIAMVVMVVVVCVCVCVCVCACVCLCVEDGGSEITRRTLAADCIGVAEEGITANTRALGSVGKYKSEREGVTSRRSSTALAFLCNFSTCGPSRRVLTQTLGSKWSKVGLMRNTETTALTLATCLMDKGIYAVHNYSN
jgi:hypothetical protein